MTDRQIIEAETKEFAEATGGMGVIAPTLLNLLQGLIKLHGSGVTVGGACDVLERLSQEATLMIVSLQRRKASQS